MKKYRIRTRRAINKRIRPDPDPHPCLRRCTVVRIRIQIRVWILSEYEISANFPRRFNMTHSVPYGTISDLKIVFFLSFSENSKHNIYYNMPSHKIYIFRHVKGVRMPEIEVNHSLQCLGSGFTHRGEYRSGSTMKKIRDQNYTIVFFFLSKKLNTSI